MQRSPSLTINTSFPEALLSTLSEIFQSDHEYLAKVAAGEQTDLAMCLFPKKQRFDDPDSNLTKAFYSSSLIAISAAQIRTIYALSPEESRINDLVMVRNTLLSALEKSLVDSAIWQLIAKTFYNFGGSEKLLDEIFKAICIQICKHFQGELNISELDELSKVLLSGQDVTRTQINDISQRRNESPNSQSSSEGTNGRPTPVSPRTSSVFPKSASFTLLFSNISHLTQSSPSSSKEQIASVPNSPTPIRKGSSIIKRLMGSIKEG